MCRSPLTSMSERTPLTLRALAAAAGGELRGDPEAWNVPVRNVVIDNREVEPGSLFVAVRGERFDGHDFAQGAAQAGAAGAVLSKEMDIGIPYVLVPDTVHALQAAARIHHDFYAPRTVAVTGSAGKTTTKEMISCVLSRQWTTASTKGNLNNQTGVPLTLFTIGPETEAAVVEMGMNHAGEIDRIAYAANPDVGIITNVGTAHIEYLGSREGILAAKCELLPHVAPDGRIFVNGDDDLLRTVSDPRVRTFGLDEACDVRAADIRSSGLEGTTFTLVWDGGQVEIRIPAPGDYMVYSALAAAACGLHYGMDPGDIAEGVFAYRPAGSRMRVLEGTYTVIDDTYNANPPAMVAALDVLAKAPGERVAILGEMRELGEQSAALHQEVLSYAATLPLRRILTVGEAYGNSNGDERIAHFATQDALLAVLGEFVQPGDTILVKGSRGVRMEQTVECLQGTGQGRAAPLASSAGKQSDRLEKPKEECNV